MKMHFPPAFCLPGSPSPAVSCPGFAMLRGCHQRCSGKRQAAVTRTECQPRPGLQSVPSATRVTLLGAFNRLQQRGGRWRAVRETTEQPGRENRAAAAGRSNSASGDAMQLHHLHGGLAEQMLGCIIGRCREEQGERGGFITAPCRGIIAHNHTETTTRSGGSALEPAQCPRYHRCSSRSVFFAELKRINDVYVSIFVITLCICYCFN